MLNLSNFSERFSLKAKIILGVLAIVILAETGWLVWSLLGANQKSADSIPSIGNVFNNATKTQVTEEDISSMISLTSPKTTYKTGEKISVAIEIASKATTDGVDIILNYDPNILMVELAPGGKAIVTGGLYSDYPLNITDSKGRITVSGVTSQTSGVIPNGTFGTINFVAKAAGRTKVSLDFSKGSTIDTNIIESKTSKDVLGKVENLEVVIQ